MLTSLLVLSMALQPDPAEHPFAIETKADFEEPWAMTQLPDGHLLVTEKAGGLKLVDKDGEVVSEFSGLPEVDYGGQGGLGDVALAPDFEDSRMVYLSFAEAGQGNRRGAAVGRGILDMENETLEDFEVIWRQQPKTTGRGHYGHRLVFSPDGEYLFISSGERQKFTPAQSMKMNLGKIIRLYPDGSIPEDNPFYDEGGVAREIWSLGHRNPLGLAFDSEGTLWEHEMGPKGGDEFQKIERGENYGYPEVSNGDHYSGRDIPDHDTDDTFRKPNESWSPVISPAGLVIYDGDAFPEWTGSALIGGLSSEALIRVSFDCELSNREICEAERYDMNTRIREVEQADDGTIYLLEDGGKGSEGRLFHLTPKD
jgi:glucose/arabinose dehydrogenase